MWLVTIVPYSLLLLLTKDVKGDGHPNQGLLPDECGFIDGDRKWDSVYARLYEFPWMARIFHFDQDGARKFQCSGTVINPRYILTVAHCAKVIASNPLRISQVRVGDYDMTSDVDCEGQGPTLLCEDQFQEIVIEETMIHENYSTKSNNANDIALLRLKTPVDFSHKNAAPVCLPLTTELKTKKLPGLEAILAGWEFMINGPTTSKLLKVNIPIREYENCTTRLGGESNEVAVNICTGGVEGVCPLESGSPLMLPCAVKEDGYRYVQYGITSFGTRKCNSQQWTSYTDVSKHVDWILDQLKA